jgi:hypothetical protein
VVENPENRELVEAWVQAVFPLILDVETKEWNLQCLSTASFYTFFLLLLKIER